VEAGGRRVCKGVGLHRNIDESLSYFSCRSPRCNTPKCTHSHPKQLLPEMLASARARNAFVREGHLTLFRCVRCAVCCAVLCCAVLCCAVFLRSWLRECTKHLSRQTSSPCPILLSNQAPHYPHPTPLDPIIHTPQGTSPSRWRRPSCSTWGRCCPPSWTD